MDGMLKNDFSSESILKNPRIHIYGMDLWVNWAQAFKGDLEDAWNNKKKRKQGLLVVY